MNAKVSRLMRLLITLLGFVAAIAALYAQMIGLDSNPDWGPSRYLLFFIGIALLAIGSASRILYVIRPARKALHDYGRFLVRTSVFNILRRGLNSIRSFLRSSLIHLRQTRISREFDRFRVWLIGLPPVAYLVESSWRRAIFFAAVILVLTFIFYFWLITLGQLNNFPAITEHFNLLAQGLARGQLHLPITPSPELLAAKNPYALEARPFMPSVWDISYFKGKFYLYWGPIPAVIALALRTLFQTEITDSILVFGLVLGSAVVGTALILFLWRRLYYELPAWIVVPPLLVMVLGIPLPWLLSRPSVYEAAIISGQFFLLLGLLLLLPTLFDHEPSWQGQIAASLSFGLAIGSRLTLAPAALFLLAAGGVVQFIRRRGFWQKLLDATRLVLPVALIGFILIAYNLARFGDPFESGHLYQLGRWNMYDNYITVVSLKNAIPNLYNYLLNPPNFLTVFPYIKPAWGEYYIWPAHYYAPEMYHTEHLTGVLIGIPFLWFGMMSLKNVFNQVSKIIVGRLKLETVADKLDERAGIPAVLLVAAGLLFSPLVVFVAASMRHMTDVVPILVLIAALGFWEAYQRRQVQDKSTMAVASLGWMLCLLSVAAGILLSFTGFSARFEQMNPELFQQITRFFTP